MIKLNKKDKDYVLAIMKSNTKIKIFFAVLMIFLCSVLMISTTFALFTSQSKDNNIRITAGTLEVDLLQADENGEFRSIANKDGDIFGSALWEPNQTRVVFLRVENKSPIPVRYVVQLSVDIGGMDGGLEYCAFESDYYDVSGLNWETFSQDKSPARMQDGLNPIVDGSYKLMNPGESFTFALAVHMLPLSGNEYQKQACTVDVHVFAVQGNASL